MSTALGKIAENTAVVFLRGIGFEVIEQNWRSRWCEIDIIACKRNCIYFVEVKYRGRSDWGTGLDYITTRKLQQMHFAAEFWRAGCTVKKWRSYQLAAIELTGDPPYVTVWLDDV